MYKGIGAYYVCMYKGIGAYLLLNISIFCVCVLFVLFLEMKKKKKERRKKKERYGGGKKKSVLVIGTYVHQ